jgi:rare lipoprotein A
MIRAATATTAAVLCLSAALALPATGWAQAATGGTSPTAQAPPATSTPTTTAVPATLQANPAALLLRRQRATGDLGPENAGRLVLVQRSDAVAGWVTVGRATADSSGRFSAIWLSYRIGRFTLRAIPYTGSAASAAAASQALTAPVTVYGGGIATYYGPGDYGNKTACGTTLTPTTIGVAHRTLPCGTRIQVYYYGHTLVVPVIDRGPFVRGVTWDLTAAASRLLRFSGRGLIGAIAIGRGAVPAR